MAFDSTKFSTAQFVDRTSDVPVQELKKFFEEDEKCVWVVKCLGANEIAIANQAMQANSDLKELIEKLTSTKSTDKIEAIQKAMGLQHSDVPDDIVRRISMLCSGSVEPKCDQETAVRISTAYSTVFYRLTNKILSLTGEGMELGE